mgnify:CR=1 FL=1
MREVISRTVAPDLEFLIFTCRRMRNSRSWGQRFFFLMTRRLNRYTYCVVFFCFRLVRRAIITIVVVVVVVIINIVVVIIIYLFFIQL